MHADSTDVRYTVAICNYNMAETIEHAVESVLDRTTDEYEVLVVDGGSTDGSLSLLRAFSASEPRLRVINTSARELSGLAADRNVAVAEARGEYVLVQLDSDDYYAGPITDFTTIYHWIERAREEPFYLKGRNINIAPREFLLSYGPYRVGLPRAEDRDLWRRLFADDAIVWLSHGQISRSIGYDPGRLQHVRNYLYEEVGEFIAGVTLRSALRYRLSTGSLIGRTLGLPIVLFAYVLSRFGPQYALHGEFERKRRLKTAVDDAVVTVRDIDTELDDFEIDPEVLSPAGRSVYLDGQDIVDQPSA